MVIVEPIWVDGHPVVAIEVRLPKTNLLVLRAESGYIMCGALDVQLLREKLAQRGVLAARAIGVKTMDELLAGTIESCTQRAEEIGIEPGMGVRKALVRMITEGGQGPL